MEPLKVSLLNAPTPADWWGVKQRALVTIGKEPVKEPDSDWKHAILEARHSPIRYLRYSFLIENVPSWVSVHLCRHVHAQPYVKSQRNDRQNEYDRNKAPQDSPVTMIFDVNAEELMVIANKRLCSKASPETRSVVRAMCKLAQTVTPELEGLLVPYCTYNGVCHELNGCGLDRQNRDMGVSSASMWEKHKAMERCAIESDIATNKIAEMLHSEETMLRKQQEEGAMPDEPTC